jgi:hypothetical protein
MAFLTKTANKSKSKKNGSTQNFGVGIVFKSGPDEALFVKSIAEGGPASYSDPPIRVNDCLCKVDGEDVRRKPINRVVEYIVGDEGSKIILTFQRFAGNKIETYSTTLKRGQVATIRATMDTRALDIHGTQSKVQSHSADPVLDSAAVPRTALAQKERHASQQARLSERLEKMKEFRDFETLSFTGRSSKEDPTGMYEGELNPVRCFRARRCVISLSFCRPCFISRF